MRAIRTVDQMIELRTANVHIAITSSSCSTFLSELQNPQPWIISWNNVSIVQSNPVLGHRVPSLQ